MQPARRQAYLPIPLSADRIIPIDSYTFCLNGNGRMGRFLMNVMLASGGYPWTVIPVQRREKYMNTLERTSVQATIMPFAKFLASLIKV